VSEERSPGWYADPSGEADRLRWWDGSAWTGIDRARMSHERLGSDGQAPAGSRPDGGPNDLLDSATGPPPRSPRRWFAVLLAVGVVAALVLTGRFPGLHTSGLAERTIASNAPAPTLSRAEPQPPPVGPPTAAPTSLRPVTGRLVDGTARLSYAVLPGSWQAWDLISFEGLITTAGYYRVVQRDTPEGGLYWANVTSGPILPSLVGADLRASARKLADALDAEYYPAHTRRDVVEQATTVDGHNAYLVRWLAVFDRSRTGGYLAKSEVVAVLLVDIGRDVPSALYLSLPDPVRSTWPSVEGLLGSVRVLR
jgi:hypothetical protein